jgi:hypothetical protein
MTLLLEYCITCNQEILDTDALDNSTLVGIYAHDCCKFKNCAHLEGRKVNE